MREEMVVVCVKEPNGTRCIGDPVRGEHYTVRKVTEFGFVISGKLYREHKPKTYSKKLFDLVKTENTSFTDHCLKLIEFGKLTNYNYERI